MEDDAVVTFNGSDMDDETVMYFNSSDVYVALRYIESFSVHPTRLEGETRIAARLASGKSVEHTITGDAVSAVKLMISRL